MYIAYTYLLTYFEFLFWINFFQALYHMSGLYQGQLRDLKKSVICLQEIFVEKNST